MRCQRAQEGTICGSIKALCFCVGQGERGGNSTTLTLQRQLLLDPGSLSCRRFCGANPKFLQPFANENSVFFKLKQAGEVSLSSMQQKMWRANMLVFVWIQSKNLSLDVGTKIV